MFQFSIRYAHNAPSLPTARIRLFASCLRASAGYPAPPSNRPAPPVSPSNTTSSSQNLDRDRRNFNYPNERPPFQRNTPGSTAASTRYPQPSFSQASLQQAGPPRSPGQQAGPPRSPGQQTGPPRSLGQHSQPSSQPPSPAPQVSITHPHATAGTQHPQSLSSSDNILHRLFGPPAPVTPASHVPQAPASFHKPPPRWQPPSSAIQRPAAPPTAVNRPATAPYSHQHFSPVSSAVRPGARPNPNIAPSAAVIAGSIGGQRAALPPVTDATTGMGSSAGSAPTQVDHFKR